MKRSLKSSLTALAGILWNCLLNLRLHTACAEAKFWGCGGRPSTLKKHSEHISHRLRGKSKKGGITVIGNDITKSKSSFRTLPLNELVKNLLLDYRLKKYGGYLPPRDSYLFTDGNGQIMKPSHLTASFSALLKKQGLRHIRFHDLRHASAGVLIANRVPLIEVQQWLGHSTIRITADLYSHLDYEIKLRSASIMKERIFDNE